MASICLMVILTIILHTKAISSTAPVNIAIFPDNVVASSQGQIFLMPCVAVSTADYINVTWQHNGQLLVPSSNMKVIPSTVRREGLLIVKSILEVRVTNIEDGGAYSCRASTHQPPDNIQEDKETFWIDTSMLVLLKSAPPSNVEVNLGTTRAFSCEFTTSHNPPTITWIIDKIPAHHLSFSVETTTLHQDDKIMVTSILNVSFHTHTLSAEYECRAENNQSKAHGKFQVDVKVPVHIIASPSTAYYDATHSTVILYCVMYGLQPPEVIWKHEGLMLTDQLHQSTVVTKRAVHGLIHIVKSFLPLQTGVGNGKYSCEATGGGLSTADGPLTFEVCLAPNKFGFLIEPTDTRVVPGSVYLSCVAYSTQGRHVNVSWTVPTGIPIDITRVTVIKTAREIGNLHISRSILGISSVSQEDIGQYTCVASDGIETQQANSTLSFFNPVFMEEGTDVQRSVKHMDSTSFTCTVSADPTTQVKWLKDGTQLLKSEKVLIQVMVTADFTKQAEITISCTLTLHALTAEDSGQYWCEAQNTLVTKEMEAKYQLTVHDSSPFPIVTPGSHISQSSSAKMVRKVLCIAALLVIIVTHLLSSVSSSEALSTVSSAVHITLLTASLATWNLLPRSWVPRLSQLLPLGVHS